MIRAIGLLVPFARLLRCWYHRVVIDDKYRGIVGIAQYYSAQVACGNF